MRSCAVSLAQSHIRYERAKRATNWALSPDLYVGSKGQVGQKRGAHNHRSAYIHTRTLGCQIETGRGEVRERGTAFDQWPSPKRGLVTNNQVNWYVTLHLNAIIAYAPRQPIAAPDPLTVSNRGSVKWVEVLLLGLRLTCAHLAASRTCNFAGSVGNQARKVGSQIGRGVRIRSWSSGKTVGRGRLSTLCQFVIGIFDEPNWRIDWLTVHTGQDRSILVACKNSVLHLISCQPLDPCLTPPWRLSAAEEVGKKLSE